MKKRSWLLFTLMVLIWGSNWSVMKIGLKFVSPLNLVMQRFLLASIALLPALALERRKLPRDRWTWIKLVLLALINAVGITSTNIGLLYEFSGLSSLLTYTQPLFVFCLAVPFLGEKVSITKALGIILGFFGVIALYVERYSSPLVFSNPILFLILGAFIWAVSVIYYKRTLTHVDPAIVNIVQFPIGTVFLLTITLMLEGLTFSGNITYIFSILYMSVFGSAIGFTIWLFLIREEEATIVSASSLIVPTIALFFGWVFLGETFGYLSLLGFLLIFIGVYLVNKPPNKSSNESLIVSADSSSKLNKKD